MPTSASPPSETRSYRWAESPRRRTWPTWSPSSSARTHATSTAMTSSSTAAWPAISSAAFLGSSRSPAADVLRSRDIQQRSPSMTIRLGMFTMPMHHPDRDYASLLAEDQEAIVLADRLGFSEAFVGEHFSSWSERITSPLMFFATLISRTKQIRFGTGVLNLPQIHPATVAAHAAMFDQLCQGRFIMGIGPGGLVSDLEIFDIGQAELRPQMVLESIETVLKLWSQDPPYEIDGKFWKISLTKGIWPDFKVGYIPRPYQKPHPPIALSLF